MRHGNKGISIQEGGSQLTGCGRAPRCLPPRIPPPSLAVPAAFPSAPMVLSCSTQPSDCTGQEENSLTEQGTQGSYHYATLPPKGGGSGHSSPLLPKRASKARSLCTTSAFTLDNGVGSLANWPLPCATCEHAVGSHSTGCFLSASRGLTPSPAGWWQEERSPYLLSPPRLTRGASPFRDSALRPDRCLQGSPTVWKHFWACSLDTAQQLPWG